MLWQFPMAETLPSWAVMILTLIDFAIRVLVLGIIPGNRRPTTAMAWLLCIFIVPTIGLLLFLLFGNFRLSRRRRSQLFLRFRASTARNGWAARDAGRWQTRKRR